jgi:hypothetical protein
MPHAAMQAGRHARRQAGRQARTEADPQVHGLRHARHVHAQHQVVADLGHSARASLPAMHDPAPHVPQHRPLRPRDAAFVPAAHEGQRARLGACGVAFCVDLVWFGLVESECGNGRQRKLMTKLTTRFAHTHAPPTPPLTGASTISRPFSRAAAIRRCEAVGSMVLLSTMSAPFLRCGRIYDGTNVSGFDCPFSLYLHISYGGVPRLLGVGQHGALQHGCHVLRGRQHRDYHVCPRRQLCQGGGRRRALVCCFVLFCLFGGRSIKRNDGLI